MYYLSTYPPIIYICLVLMHLSLVSLSLSLLSTYISTFLPSIYSYYLLFIYLLAYNNVSIYLYVYRPVVTKKS